MYHKASQVDATYESHTGRAWKCDRDSVHLTNHFNCTGVLAENLLALTVNSNSSLASGGTLSINAPDTSSTIDQAVVLHRPTASLTFLDKVCHRFKRKTNMMK